MLSTTARNYYLNGDYNCAEAMLLAIRDEYGLDIARDTLRLMSGFGGGMGCGRACGALLGSVAGLGPLLVKEKAHATEGFSQRTAELARRFVEALGDDQCAVLKPQHVQEGLRCVRVVERSAEIFEQYAAELGLQPETQP